MYKSLLEIFEEYFFPQINIKGSGINTDIERYETCYNLLHSLLSDLDEMGKCAGGNFPLPIRWEDNLDTYFNDCITEYIYNNDDKNNLTEENADKYIPYEYDYCEKCGTRCYYGAYPETIENNNGEIVCENCFEEEN